MALFHSIDRFPILWPLYHPRMKYDGGLCFHRCVSVHRGGTPCSVVIWSLGVHIISRLLCSKINSPVLAGGETLSWLGVGVSLSW